MKKAVFEFANKFFIVSLQKIYFIFYFQIDNLFETEMSEGSFDIGGRMFDTSIGYYGSEVVAVYKSHSQRRKRQTSDLVVEVEISAKDGAIDGTEIDAVYSNGTLSGFTVLSSEPSSITICRYLSLSFGI